MYLNHYFAQIAAQFAAHHVRRASERFYRPADLRRNAELRNRHAGERLFILGSGPSIKGLDLCRLAQERVMTQNNFFVHPDISRIAPLYHVVVPMFHPPENDGDWRAWFGQMAEHLPASTRYFFSQNSESQVGAIELLRDRSQYYRARLNPLFMSRYDVDLTYSVPIVYTATTLCVTVALYLGFTQIFLIGFDHDQFCQAAQKSPEAADYRFYASSKIADTESEKSMERQAFLDGSVYRNFWLIQRELTMLREYADAHGQEIVNLAPGGLLYSFRRDTYDRVVPSTPMAISAGAGR